MKRHTWGGVLVSLLGAQAALAQGASIGASGSASTDAAPAATTTSDAAVPEAAPVSTDTLPQAEPGQAEMTPSPIGPPPYAGERANPNHSMSDSARFAAVPYMQRFKPHHNLWEVGLFTGLLFPSPAHNLQRPGSNAEAYNTVSPEFGARIAYFPLSFLGVEAEGMISPTETRATNDTALLYAARAHGILQLPFYSIVPFVTVGGGVLGASSQVMGHDADPAFHFGVGAKVPVHRLVSIRLDLRDTLTQKRNTPQGTAANSFDILLGATFTFDRNPPPMPVDTDYDGLYDTEDKCPTKGALTADGCPGDSDGDGLFDAEDHCPNQAATTADGCPEVAVSEADADMDGIPVPCDMCPDTKGVAPDGCAIKDTDGDGFNDDVDKCPSEAETRNGFEDNDGCPDQMPEAMKRFTGVMTGIAFDQGKATIRKESYATLDAAYEVLDKYQSIRIEISGHTSSEGTAEVNQKLSEQRAASVKAYLVTKGIADDRVISRGAGPTEPIADNATRPGREQNRRIEFKIVAAP